MISASFKLKERGFKDTLVLIPGWAADYRIFGRLNLDYNYLSPIGGPLFDFSARLLESLNKKSIAKVSLFGWSLGGFLGAEFAVKHPAKVNELILLGIRRKHDNPALKEIKARLIKNKKAFLYKFYLECFSDTEKEGLFWFKKNLLKDYINRFRLKDLIGGLDYLSKAGIAPESLAKIEKLRVFHGLEDKIAPVKEVQEMESRLPEADFVYMPGTGHLPFMAKDFALRFYENR